ncbi:MAG: HemK/PrmC family methyltransferase [Planctomycetota bacterium]
MGLKGKRHKADIPAGTLLDEAASRLKAAGITPARAEAEILLAAVLEIPRQRLVGETGAAGVSREQGRRFSRLVGRRATGEPSAYLAGEKEFYGRPFLVRRGVLVPRPETETLVEGVLQWIRGHCVGANLRVRPCRAGRTHGSAPTRERDGEMNADVGAIHESPLQQTNTETILRAADLGSGSGCIAVTLACEIPSLRIDAVERSGRAARIARENARRLGVLGRVRVRRAEMIRFLVSAPVASYDLVVSNPPYVAESELGSLDRSVRDFEPMEALVAGPTGLDFLWRIIDKAGWAIRPGGLLALEVGLDQADKAATIARDVGCWRMACILNDLSGIPRGVLLERLSPDGTEP